MNRFVSKIIGLVLATLVPLTACAATLADPIEGQVLQKETNQPIAGAIVIVRWKERIPMGLIDSRTECTHVESTTTDSDGRYRLPGWKSEALWLLDAYKAGYEYAERGKGVVYLKPFRAGRVERFQTLWRIFSATGCHAAGRSGKNLYLLYKAAYEESKPLAATEEEKRLLQIMRELTASAWLAEEGSRTTSEEQKLIREYLRDHLQ